LHGGWDHLIGNSIPLLILGPAILIKGWENLVSASFFSALVAGVFVLIVGAQGSWHIGASSVVFGYFGFLVGMGYYERSPVSVIFAFGVIIFYGGAVYTMFPTEFARANHISWEGHLGGAVGGFWASKQRSKLGQRRR
jgi:membrane associated rhomboid family serine protease